MIYSACVPNGKTQNVSKKKYINIKDQYTEEQIMRIPVHSCMSISTIKQKIQQKIGGVGGGIGNIRLRYKQQLLQNNNASVAEYNIKNESTLYYSPLQSIDGIGMIHPQTIGNKINKTINLILAEIKKALNSKIIPKLIESGISGSYFIENVERNNVAIFKPLDEEPYAPNNPKGYVGKLGQRGIRQGIRSGEQGYREVVAYLLDPQGIHGVPPTTFVEFYHPSFKFSQTQIDNNLISDQKQQQSDLNKSNISQKINDVNIDQVKRGSLQVFVKNTDECGNYGNSIFPIDEVHKIAILDIRILNCDRNDQNILVKKKKKKKLTVNPQELKKLPSYKAQLLEYDFQLIPIDHGLSLPDSFDICQDDLNWMWWEQSEQNFSEKSLEYISQIDIEQDIKLLQQQFNLREQCLRNFRIANIVLKKGAASGLTLKEIGNIIYREDTDIESTIEKLIKNAHHYANICINGGNSDIIKKKIQKDMAKNNIKRQAINMPIIQENSILEDNPNFDSFNKQCPVLNNSNNIDSPFKNKNIKDILKEEQMFLQLQSPQMNKVDSYQSNLSYEYEEGANYFLSPISSFKDDKQNHQKKQHHNHSHESKIKRSFSLPDLQSIKIKNQFNDQSNDNTGKNNDKKQTTVKFNDENQSINYNKSNFSNRTLDKNHTINVTKKNDLLKLKKQSEDIFFYYFENVLDMHIEKINLEKLNPTKGRMRGRLNSEEITKKSLFQYNS